MFDDLMIKEMEDEIREWQTQSVKHKIAMLLIMDGISFSYDVRRPASYFPLPSPM